jgi:3-oxoacyl-[acyl-carrier protein] reductase
VREAVGPRLLDGKVALVTGAASGIGRGIAVRLAEDGASVAVNFRSREDAASNLVDELVGRGARAVLVQADVADHGEIARMFTEVQTHFGRLDILVANAARFLQKPIVDVTDEEFDAVFDTNVRGTFFCMQEAGRRMEPGGRIIAISATGPARPQATRAVYHASKAALEHFVKVLAIELGPRQVTVNAVAPGVTRTEGMVERNPTLEERASREIPLGRIGEVDDIADVVAFFAGDAARWVTGQVIRANGGQG